jgi:hypothetical protein
MRKRSGFRATMLSMIPGMLAPWTHNDELDDAVFQIAATIPMRKVKIDVAQEGPPFDVKEFLKAIEAATKGSTPGPVTLQNKCYWNRYKSSCWRG